MKSAKNAKDLLQWKMERERGKGGRKLEAAFGGVDRKRLSSGELRKFH